MGSRDFDYAQISIADLVYSKVDDSIKSVYAVHTAEEVEWLSWSHKVDDLPDEDFPPVAMYADEVLLARGTLRLRGRNTFVSEKPSLKEDVHKEEAHNRWHYANTYLFPAKLTTRTYIFHIAFPHFAVIRDVGGSLASRDNVDFACPIKRKRMMTLTMLVRHRLDLDIKFEIVSESEYGSVTIDHITSVCAQRLEKDRLEVGLKKASKFADLLEKGIKIGQLATKTWWA